MFTDIFLEFRHRKENNNTMLDILNMFWVDSSVTKEFQNDSEDNDFPLYFSHPDSFQYF